MARHVAVWLGLLVVATGSSLARGATYTWDAGGSSNTSWSTAANWAGDTLPTFAAGDTFDLSTRNITANSTSTMDTANTLGAIRIGDTNNSHTWTLALTGALTLDGNGSAASITQIATSKGATISGAGGIGLASDLTITNSANTNTLVISSTISAATTGTKTLTNSGAGTGAVNLSGVVIGGSGSLLIVQNSPSSQLNLTSQSSIGTPVSFAVTSGTLYWSPGASVREARGAVALGIASGTGNATFSLAGRSSLTGTISVFGSGSNAMLFGSDPYTHLVSGAVDLNDSDLTLSVTGSGGVRMQGGVTGTGNIIVNNSNAGGNGVDFRIGQVNNAGEVRNISTGTAGIRLGSDGVSNGSFGAKVTSLVQNSATAPWDINYGNNDFVGTVQVLAGVVLLNNVASLNSANEVFVASGGTLDVQVANTIAGLSDVSGLGGTITTTSTASDSVLTIGGTGAYGFSGLLTDGATRKLGLTKSGVGVQTLTGTSTYTGATTVAAGTLLVNGELGATATTVDAGALLGGSGSIGGLVTVSGTLSPGNSPGVIELASLVLESTATTLVEITGTSRGLEYDGIDITTSGGLSYGGTLVFDLSALFAENTVFDVFSFAGTPTGSFSSVISTGSYAGTWTNNNDGTFSLAQGSQTLTFSQSSGDLVVVPEPTALVLMVAGAVAWAGGHRRRFPSGRRRHR